MSMTTIVVFDQHRKPQFTITLSNALAAAKAVLDALRNPAHKYAKVETGKAVIVVSGRSPVGVRRLADAIVNDANVEFA
jgi:hypothetical protein